MPIFGIKFTGGENEDSPGSSGRCPRPRRCGWSPRKGFGLWAGVANPLQLLWGMKTWPSASRAAGTQNLPTYRKWEAGAQTQPGHLERAPGPPSSKVTWPYLPPTYPPAGTFIANSIFAPLGSSVEIKRLFAVTNVANSDQTI